MANRSTFRVAETTDYRSAASTFLHRVREKFHFSMDPKASGFAQSIGSLDKGEEAIAFAMYAGDYCFGDESFTTSAPHLFNLSKGSQVWQESLFNLSWLRHFTASKRKLHIYYALRLVGYWAKSARSRKSITARSEALIALSSHGSELVLAVDELSQAEFLLLISKLSASLHRKTPHNSQEAFLQAVAELYVGTAFRGLDYLLQPASDKLSSTIEQLVNLDGGIRSRDPNDMIVFMSLLLPLQAAMKSSHQIFPANAADALQRMFPLLAMLTRADGSLSTLFDHSETKKILATLKTFDKDAEPLRIASQMGYARLVGGKSILFIDTKKDFAFEFTDAGHQIFQSFCESQYEETRALLHDSEHGETLQVILNNNRERIYFLNSEGTDLRVEDRFSSSTEIIFSLAPGVKIATRREGGIMFIAPDQSVWNLSLRGGEARVEQNGAVIRITSTAAGKMNWAIKKQSKVSKANSRKKTSEPDLLV